MTGEELRRVRMALGMPLSDFAHKLGRSVGWMSKAERLERISYELEHDVEVLIDEQLTRDPMLKALGARLVK